MSSFENIQEQLRQSKELLKNIKHEVTHALHTSKLSLELFDQLKMLHNLGVQERCWLECASYLHDIGWIIAGPKHHKHSLRMILNADMPAFTDRELRIVANIARYHRRSLPAPSHSAFSLLSPEDQNTVEILSSLLRLSDGLDKSHKSYIHHVQCVSSNGEITFKAVSEESCIDEINAVERKKDLFLKVFGKNFRLVLQETEAELVYLEAAN